MDPNFLTLGSSGDSVDQKITLHEAPRRSLKIFLKRLLIGSHNQLVSTIS